jgi:hypothetical protein
VRWLVDLIVAQASGNDGGIFDRPVETIPLLAGMGALIAGAVRMFRYLTRTVLDSNARQLVEAEARLKEAEARLKITLDEADACRREVHQRDRWIYQLERLLAKNDIEPPEEPTK